MFNKVKNSMREQAVRHTPSRETMTLTMLSTFKKLYGDNCDEIINVMGENISKYKGNANSQYLMLNALLCYAIELNKNYDKNKNYLERIINIIIEYDTDDAKFSTGYIFLVHHDDRLGNKINDYYNSTLKERTELCIPFMGKCIYRNFSFLAQNNEQFVEWKKILIKNKISFDFFTYMMDSDTLMNVVAWDQFYTDLPDNYKLGVII